MEPTPPNKTNSTPDDQNNEVETKPTEESIEEKADENSEPKENERAATTSACIEPSLLLSSSRNDLIKDIESHIEIIYECLDDLNDTGSTSSVNKTQSSEAIISISSETDLEKTLNDSIEEVTVEDSDAQEESKIE